MTGKEPLAALSSAHGMGSPFDACMQCHDQCVSACPVARVTGDTRFYPSRLALLAQSWADGHLSLSFDEAVGVFYGGCIACGLCEAHCVYQDAPKSGWRVAHAMRVRLAAQGAVGEAMAERIDAVLSPEQKKRCYDHLVDRLAKDTAVQVVPVVAASRGREAEGNDGPRDDSPLTQPPTLLLVDPYSAAWMPEGVIALSNLLASHGQQVVVFDEAMEAGGLLWQEGLVHAAENAALRVEALVAPGGYGRVVTTLPNDAWYWRVRDHEGSLRAGVRLLSALEAVATTLTTRDGHGSSESAQADKCSDSAHLPRVVVQPSSVLARHLNQASYVHALLMHRAHTLEWPSPMRDVPRVQPVAVEGAGLWVEEALRRRLAMDRMKDIAALAPDVVLTCDPFSHHALTTELHNAGCRWDFRVESLYEFMHSNRWDDCSL